MPKFPYDRAALVLSEATYFGKKLACQKYHVPQALFTIQEGLEKHPFSYQPQSIEEKELWGTNILALSKMVKSIGDLTIAGDVLTDDSNDNY